MPKKRKNQSRRQDIVCGTLVIGQDGMGRIDWASDIEGWIRIADDEVTRVGADLVRDWIRELEPMVRRDADRMVAELRQAISRITEVG